MVRNFIVITTMFVVTVLVAHFCLVAPNGWRAHVITVLGVFDFLCGVLMGVWEHDDA